MNCQDSVLSGHVVCVCVDSDSGPLRLARTPTPPDDESPDSSPAASPNHTLRPISPGPPRPKSPSQVGPELLPRHSAYQGFPGFPATFRINMQLESLQLIHDVQHNYSP